MSSSRICMAHGNLKPCWSCVKAVATRKAKSSGPLDRVKTEIVEALKYLGVGENGEEIPGMRADEPGFAVDSLLKALAELRKVPR